MQEYNTSNLLIDMPEENKTKELRSFTLEVRASSVRFIPESKPDYSHRTRLNRDTDAIVFPEIAQRAWNIAKSTSRIDALGRMVGKYNIFIGTLPPKPKSSQGTERAIYKERLIKVLREKEQDLLKFKDREIFIYIAVYLRPRKFKRYDTDNFPKAIVDAVKVFTGDDNKAISVFTDKIQLENYPQPDLDFLEQVLLVVADPAAKLDVIKGSVQ